MSSSTAPSPNQECSHLKDFPTHHIFFSPVSGTWYLRRVRVKTNELVAVGEEDGLTQVSFHFTPDRVISSPVVGKVEH